MASDITLYKEKDSYFFKEVSSKKDVEKLDSTNLDGFVIDTKGNEKEARRIIDSLKGKKKLVAVKSYNNAFNRRAIEKLNINFIYDIENSTHNDTVKQRDSGINDVIAKIAKKRNITFLIDVNHLSTMSKENKVKTISRIIQNIKICRKNKCNIGVVSFAKNKSEVLTKKQKESFLYSLGASSNQVKNSLIF